MSENALVRHFSAHWGKWAVLITLVAAVIVGAFVCKDSIAVWAGYAATAAQAATVPDDGGISPGARLFRDFMVLFIAVIGLVLAVVRAIVLHGQAEIERNQFELANSQFQHQTDAATRQFNQAESRMFDERFSTAAELMAKEIAGKPAIAARVSGINIMDEVANAAPDVFLTQTVKTMVAYIKDNAAETAKKPLQIEPENQLLNILDVGTFALGEDVKSAFAVLHRILSGKDVGGKMNKDVLDLSGQHFRKLDFGRAQIEHYTNWSGTNLQGARLYKATFHKGVRLINTDFSKAVLSSADLTEAKLTLANMRETHLDKADLRGAVMHCAVLQGARLQEAKMHGSDLSHLHPLMTGKEANDSDFSKANLRGAKLEFANLRGADMTGADLRGASLHGADLRGADLSDAKFGATNMTGVEIDSASLTDSVKEAMSEGIWYAPEDKWAQGIADNDRNPKWDLELRNDDDYYALAGIVRNFVVEIDPKFGGETLRGRVRKLLDEGKLPPEHATRVRGYLEEKPKKGGKPSDAKNGD